MSNLKARLTALEAAVPKKAWFTIEVEDMPTPDEWELINEAHAEGRMVFIFQSQSNTLGVFMPGADAVHWSADNG
ncbi:MAG: hypothetical protein M0R47_09565 [Methylobacter sp.]|uniref:hypothetical protein n=1 Tax=Methylobacter sp. TaxID=2051955 RepID=UPI0025D67307|nr:hypothetical protein [Methylobacter sp.]MCK9620767.1 hypothetical protein [Methylobacter sp.]